MRVGVSFCVSDWVDFVHMYAYVCACYECCTCLAVSPFAVLGPEIVSGWQRGRDKMFLRNGVLEVLEAALKVCWCVYALLLTAWGIWVCFQVLWYAVLCCIVCACIALFHVWHSSFRF